MINHQRWTKEEEDYLRIAYKSLSISEIVRNFYYYFYIERSESSIRNKVCSMGLKREDGLKRINND